MITNERIEESLKNANLWFHTNTYFFGKISELKVDINAVSGSKRTSAKYLINLTENDIIIIPVISSGISEELFTEETIDICSGDVEKVVVVPQNGYYYKLEVIKRDGEVINIIVNTLTDDFQRKNIIKFVENFRNEGAETLFREEFRPSFSTSNYSNINSDVRPPLAKIFTILLFVYIVGFFAFVFAGILGYEDIFELFPLLVIGFIIVWVFGVLSSVSNVLKGINKENMDVNKQINRDKPSFSKMSQEQREEAREKRSEDIITSSGPIVSNDENYGGIKKM